MTRASILVVRGDGPDADGLEQHLRGLGYDVCAVAASVDEAVERAAETAPDAALMDLDPAVALDSGAEVNGAAAGMNGVDAGANGPSPEMNGLASARRIGAALHIPVVCLTETADGFGGIFSPPPSTGYPLTFVLKPFDARQLRLSLDTALSLREWEGRHRETRTRLEHRVEEMREHIHMMDVIFNSMEEGVLATDQDGERLAFNVGAVRIGGMREPNNNIDEWAAMHGVYLLDKKTLLPVEENPLVLAMLGRETDDQELFVRNEVQPQGVYISVTGRPLKDISNRQRGGVIVFRDITAQKTADVAMRGAFAEGRVEGVDTILHNIGNAISSVTTGVETIHSELEDDRLVRRLRALSDAIEAHGDDWIDYLQSHPQGRKVRPFILSLAEDISRQNRRLARTVGRVRDRAGHIADIVRTQRWPSGPAAAERNVNLRKTLWDAVRVVQESHADERVRFHVDCAKAPKEVSIHESPFHQMLINVVGNAVQAIRQRRESAALDEEPCVRIQAGSANGSLDVEVTDNGIGFVERDTRKFFAAGYTTKESGTGLGLHSAANFVVGAGGRIEISSPGLGKGATVRIGLRLPPPPRITHSWAEPGGTACEPSVRPMRMLDGV